MIWDLGKVKNYNIEEVHVHVCMFICEYRKAIYLKLVSKVDDNGVAHWGNINPVTILEELQSTDLVILEQ